MITPKLHKQYNNQFTFKIMWEYQTCQQSDVSQLHFFLILFFFLFVVNSVINWNENALG